MSMTYEWLELVRWLDAWRGPLAKMLIILVCVLVRMGHRSLP